MIDQIYIYHHLGLGDHFHCNGGVRYLLDNKYKGKKVNLFAKVINENGFYDTSRKLQRLGALKIKLEKV